MRPFFLSPSGAPTSYKPAYDFLSYLATQLAFSFAVAPFVLLDLRSCLLVWSRVYFYCILGVALSVAFFASPAKAFLSKTLKARNRQTTVPSRPGMDGGRSASQRSVGSIENETVLGLPSDPVKDFDDAVHEVLEEVEARRGRGSAVTDNLVEQVTRDKGI